ncbi:MAG: NUDIX domain-containing protein [archaeon]
MDGPNDRKLFKQFVYAERLSFSEIARRSKIPSNLLAYFVKKMVKKGILQKTSEGSYELSSKGEKLLPFYTEIESITPLVVVLVMLVKGGKILLLKRKRRPYRGLWGIISGRMLLDESINSATKRICAQKAGAVCVYEKVSAVVHERLIDGEAKHSFVFFVVRAMIKSKDVVEISSSEEELKWFSLVQLPKKSMIASDYWLVKNKLNARNAVVEEVLKKNGRLMRFMN